MKQYKWIASSNDGIFEDESRQEFTSKKECYEDMRNAALEKMKWNTQFNEDFCDVADDEYIGYQVQFRRNKIIHESYSGIYTYEMKEVSDKKNVSLTDSQIKTLKAALRVAIDESPFRLTRFNTIISEDYAASERIQKSMKRENESRKQILELLETI